MDLKCKKLDCYHNDRYCCTKEGIKVSKSCECMSYEENKHPDKAQMQDVSKTMLEAAPDIHPYRHKRNIDIECDADCLFNCNCKCQANGISVCNCAKTPICTTFIKD